ncbi:RHS repeat domain-containing protein [Aeromicrobium sp.]|uniref:RHS repeat domain-containing protein n=1 Tax=Aeromicrobium sp. TaxID=1871063 RepID=UPI002FCB8D7B
MRKLTLAPRRAIRARTTARVCTIAPLSILLTASLLVSDPSFATAAEESALSPEKTKSVDVAKVGYQAAAGDYDNTKTVPAPEVTWPEAGETTESTVSEQFPIDASGDADVAVRSDDPNSAPAAVEVTSLGQLNADYDIGPGVSYTITPKVATTDDPSPEPTAPSGTTPAPSNNPESDTASQTAVRTILFSIPSLSPDTEEPSPTSPTPTPTTPEPSTDPGDENEPEPPPADDNGTAEDFTAPIELQINYDDFRGAVGGGWASRLRAVQLVDCPDATTNEDDSEDSGSECESVVPLESTNDTEAKTVTAVLPAESYAAPSATTEVKPAAAGIPAASSAAAPMTVALVATPAGDAGSFSSTPMSASSEWSGGGQSGDFTWSYPLPAPPAGAGPAPDLSLDYSSSSVDGRTSSTNNQTSGIGEGFSLDPGSIERSFSSCGDNDTDDGSNAPSDSADLCWRDRNISLTLGGKSTSLVQKSGAEWRLKDDDGTKVIRLVDAHGTTSNINDDNTSERWVVTTPDGTKYYYGLNKRDTVGVTNDSRITDSVSTVRVYGAFAGDPCHESSFHDSDCVQAWRWGLDYVEDPSGNTMSLFYTQEENMYGAEGADSPSNKTTYDRAALLKRIEYGTRKDTASGQAPLQVTFGHAWRCDNDCTSSDFKTENASHWPDVPIDQYCTNLSEMCANRPAPTFWSRYMTDKITTEVRTGSGTYEPVNTWNLSQSFPNTYDGTNDSLWLFRLQQVAGSGSSAVTLPPVGFKGEEFQNRVDAQGDGIAMFAKYRVRAILNGAGGNMSINYSGRDCTATDKPTSPDTNSRRCFPSFYQRDFAKGRQLEYFHKYLVNSVVESDQTGGSPPVTTKYTYVGAPAWHWTESNLELPKYRTWSDWRGYGKVITQVGKGDDATWSESLYMRGMNGDPTSAGGTKSVTISDGTESPSIVDDALYNGFVRRTTTKLGDTGPMVERTVNTPTNTITATDASNGFKARIINTANTQTTTAVTGGPDSVVEQAMTYDSLGRETQTHDKGDTSVSSDDRCTVTSYNDNEDVWITDAVKSETTTAGVCGATIDSGDKVISATRNFYDDDTDASGDAPTRGLVTTVKSLSKWTSGGGIEVDHTDVKTTYDASGKPTSVEDAAGAETTTAYTPATGQPTQIVTTNALDQTTTQKLNVQWGSVDQSTDVAGRKTDYSYDVLGRVTSAWVPGREKSTGLSATYKFAYVVSDSSPNSITSQTLNAAGGYTTSVDIFDGLLRSRQTQTLAADSGGGRMISDTVYDTRGWVESQRGPYFNTGDASTTLVQASTGSIPAYTDYTYDRAGRATKTTLMSHGSEKWHTTTEYGGDRTTVTPPTGGTKTTTVVDARGQTTALRQYETGSSFDETTYTYTPSGQLKTVKDPSDIEWVYGYDIRGRQVSLNDPDKGFTTTEYDDLDRPITTEDNDGKKLWTGYDVLGRKTELRDDNDDGTLRASWLYDTEQEGALTSSTRHTAGGDYATSYTYDGAGRPASSTLRIPESVDDLYRADGYTTSMSYYPNGLPRQVLQPSTEGTGLLNESLNYTYDALGNVKTLTGAGALVAGTTYTADGMVTQRVLGSSIGKSVYDTRDYDNSTRRLTRQAVSLQTSATETQLDQKYGYDPAGNVTSLDDDSTAAGATPMKQCFDYDYLRRMTDAWSTDSTDCAAPTTATLGTQSPYWDAYTYDKSGNRKTWVQIRGAGGASSTTHVSDYPAAIASRPHGVTSVVSSGSSPQTETLTYDNTGNTVTRAGGEVGDQTITWDREGHQESVTNAGTDEVTSFVYDADGNRILKTDQADDSVTLYVGNSEYKVKAESKSLVRSYSVGSEPVATRTAAGLTVLIGDRNNTGQLAINAATLVVQKRQFTPFGEDLTTPLPAWPNEHGYLDKTKDTSTGTTHLGAREYDPKLGRFMSVDPIMDPMDPQQMNGYAYANNSPVTTSDPSGLFTTAGSGGNEHPTQYTATYRFGITKVVPRIDRGSGRVYAVRRSHLVKTGSKKDLLGGLASTFSSLGDLALDVSPLARLSGLSRGTPGQDFTDWLFGAERGTLNYQRGEAVGLLGLLLGGGPRAATMAAEDAARTASLTAKAANTGIRATRQSYVDSARAISDDGLARVASGESAEVVARGVVESRNALKVQARQNLPAVLNRWAEWRNTGRYGNPVGPTYEGLIGRPGATDLSIIQRAGSTSPWINRLLGVQ